MRQVAPDIEQYEVVREIGRGGMATVYLARHRALDRLVALKQLHTVALDDPQQVERFLREARIGANLIHPNIVTVYDCFEQDGVPYIAMEHLARGSLRGVQDALTPPQIAGVLEGVLAGLGEAARHDVVHRDLKPENVLISEQGGVKIADFGIAKAIGQTGSERSLTATGMAMGTLAYMAPEQALGETVGVQTDLYSLGVVAYELLAGAPPFQARTTPVAILMRRVTEPPPDPRERRPDLDDELAEAVLALLAKRPEDRPADPAAAWALLEPIFARVLGPDWRSQASLATRAPHEPLTTGYVTYQAPPPLSPPQTEEPFEVTETAPEPDRASGVIAHEPLNAAIEPVDAVEPEAEASEVEVDAGGQETLAVHVRNEGDTVAHYDLSIVGIPEAWWTASPSVVYLNPWGKGDQSEATIVVTFQPPRAPEAQARRWPLTVAVQERGDGGEAAARNVEKLDVGLTIRPFIAFEASLRPQEVHGRRADLAVLVRNRGNAPLHVRLGATDVEDACRFRMPSGASADPGAEGTVPATIAPRRPRWFGRPTLRRFEIAVTPSGGEEDAARLPGVYHEHARFPWWLPRLLLAVLAAAALAAAALAALRDEPSSSRPVRAPAPAPTETATATPTAVPAVAVPNVVGLSLAQARARLEATGLELGDVRPPDLPKDTEVRRQDPSAGTDVDKGSAVALFLATVKVPPLRGLTLEEARRQLAEAGLAEGTLDPAEAGLDWVIRGQDPAAGERAAPETEIALRLREPAPPPFSGTDAVEVAQAGAQRWAPGSDPTVDGCDPSDGDAWICSATLTIADSEGNPNLCTIFLDVFPSDAFDAFTTTSGATGEARVSDDSDCRSIP